MKLFPSLFLALYITLPVFGKSYYRNNDSKKQFEKANTFFKKGKHDKAIKAYRSILRTRQDLPEVYFNLGIAYFQTKQYADAISAFESALKIKPDYPKAAYQLGKAFEAIDKKPQAQLMYTRALQSDPNHFDAMIPLATLYAAENHFDEAIKIYKKAAHLQPKNAQLLIDLANALNSVHRTEEALEWYFNLLDLIPGNPSVLYNIAYTLKKLNRLEEALPYYRRVLEINPNHTEAHFSYGLALLLTGNKHPDNWSKGWAEYEWRWQRQDKQSLRRYAQPFWKGEDLHGKILFIWSEQGLGDTFEFVRYAQIAKTMGARKVIVAVQDAVYNIIKLCPYIDEVLHLNDNAPFFDYHAPMLSMPHLTKTKLNNVPNKVPYLFADPTLVDEWKEILSTDTNFKIGICWHGNPNYSTQFLRLAVAPKSMEVTQFLPLMQMPNVTVYSLQKTTGTDQLNNLPTNAPLIIFEGDFDESKGRFMDTAAVIKNLDLIITVDTSICHLAAALGVPTWNLLPNPPDWRWMLDCDNTPWYPNMRLFRQPTPGDWDSVIRNVLDELKAHLEGGKPLITFTQPFA